MLSLRAVDARAVVVGDGGPRRHLVALAGVLPVLASAAFLFGRDADRILVPLFWVAVAFAVYGGWRSAGVLASASALFTVVLWRFVFPPLVGYLRGTTAPRYAPLRFLGYEQPPRAELIEGLTNGPKYGLVVAVLLGSALYSAGLGVRWLRNWVATSR